MEEQKKTITTQDLCQMILQAQFNIYREKEVFDSKIKALNDLIKPLTEGVLNQDKEIELQNQEIEALKKELESLN